VVDGLSTVTLGVPTGALQDETVIRNWPDPVCTPSFATREMVADPNSSVAGVMARLHSPTDVRKTSIVLLVSPATRLVATES